MQLVILIVYHLQKPIQIQKKTKRFPKILSNNISKIFLELLNGFFFQDNLNQTILKTNSCPSPYDKKQSTSSSAPTPPPPSSQPPPNKSKLILLLIIAGATAGGIALAYNKKKNGNNVIIVDNIVKKKSNFFSHFMNSYIYPSI